MDGQEGMSQQREDAGADARGTGLGKRPPKAPRLWRERPSKSDQMLLPRFTMLPSERVILAHTPSSVEKAFAALLGATSLGFDTESRPVFQAGMKGTGPHLIQLATDEAVVLFPLTGLELHPTLRQILEDESVAKVGFGLGGDKAKLFAKYRVRMRGGVELSGMVEALGFRQRVGLQTAVAVVLGQYLVKPKKITTSNWGARPLTAAQIAYAANDAMASLRVYRALRPAPTAEAAFSAPPLHHSLA